MDNKEKIKKINAIYNEFLGELTDLKDKADDRTRVHIESIEKKQIGEILDKINNQD